MARTFSGPSAQRSSLTAGLAGVAVVAWFDLFSGSVDTSGQDEFGRETEEDIIPLSQKLLRACIAAAGYALLCRSTSHSLVSLVLLLLIFFRRYLLGKWHELHMAIHADVPGRHLAYGLLSPQQFDELGKVYTKGLWTV